MKKSSLHLNRLSGLIRTRVILSCVGLFVMYKQPQVGHDVVAMVGLALGVSAIDAYRTTLRKDDEGNG